MIERGNINILDYNSFSMKEDMNNISNNIIVKGILNVK